MLKLKAAIYRYTGVYLAYREELDYVCSEEFWESFKEVSSDAANDDDCCDFTPQDIQGILIGMWQAEHGFTRPMVSWEWGRKGLLVKAAARFASGLLALKWDIENIFKRKRKG